MIDALGYGVPWVLYVVVLLAEAGLFRGRPDHDDDIDHLYVSGR